MENNKVNKSVKYSRKYYRNPINWMLTVLALMSSWYFNHSIGWLIFHFFVAPGYLIYCLLIGRFADGQFMNMIHHYF